MRIGVANNEQYISRNCCAADESGYVAERHRKKLPQAGIGKSCFRFERLSDLDESTLRELIRETGVDIQTLRYHERRGLLEQPRRTPSGYRSFTAGTVRVVRAEMRIRTRSAQS